MQRRGRYVVILYHHRKLFPLSTARVVMGKRSMARLVWTGLFVLAIPSVVMPSSYELDSFQENCDHSIPTSAWKAAQKLQPPEVSSTDHGEAEGAEWWLRNEALLQRAWKEWEQAMTVPDGDEGTDSPHHIHWTPLPPLNASLIDPDLVSRVKTVWENPTQQNEEQVYQSWNESLHLPPAEGYSHSEQQVFQYANLLTADGVAAVRRHLDAIADSGIPIRRPNGMNRYGALFDPSVPGAVGSNVPLVEFLDMLASDFVRPLGRLFFPNHAGSEDDDAQHYAFTIRYSEEEDVELREHSDASVVTLNLNLNLPNEGDYEGSSIYFVTEHDQQIHDGGGTADRKRRQRHELTFESGMALVHRGMVRHGAMPISRGHRHNLVLWLYGKDGSVRFAPYPPEEQMTVQERWSRSSSSAAAANSSYKSYTKQCQLDVEEQRQ